MFGYGGIIICLFLFLHTENGVDASNTTEETDCYTGDAHDYVGTKATTMSGYECQRWDEQTPHDHGYTDDQFPDGSKCEAKNYCRDPGYDGYMWCYTTDPDMRWEACDVPKCEEPVNKNDTFDCYIITDQDREDGMTDREICESQNKTRVCKESEDVPPGCEDCDGCCQTKDCTPYYIRYYEGTWHRTPTGRQCQRWDSQTPHSHVNNESWKFPIDDSVTEAQNYCRDPDYSGFLWCYTTDPDSRWEDCKIPYC